MSDFSVNASNSTNAASSFSLGGSGTGTPQPSAGTDIKLVPSDLEKLKKLYPNLDDKRAEELLAKNPNLLSLQPNERDKIVNGSQIPADNIAKPDEKSEKSNFSDTVGANFNFEEFSKKDIKDKAKSLLEEYAKNQYKKEWDTFSDEKKAQLIKDSANKLISKYNKTGEKTDIEKIIQDVQNPEKMSKLSDSEKKRINQRLLSLMTDIQAANQENISISDFYNTEDKDVRNSQKFELIQALIDKGSDINAILSESDKSFYESEKIVVDSARKYLNDENLSSSEISQRIKKYNSSASPDKKISRASLVYNYLSKKPENELSETEKKIFNSYKHLKENGINLSKIKDFDSGNSTFVKMYENETYQKVLSQNKGKKDAHKTAMIAYLNEQFKSGDGKALTKEEFNKRFDELLAGCSMQGAQELMLTAAEMKKRNYIVFKDKSLVVNEQAIIASGDKTNIADYNQAVKEGVINADDNAMFSTYLENVNFKRLAKNPDDTESKHNIKELRRAQAHNIDLKSTVKIAKELGVTDEVLFELADDVNTNRDKYDNKARCAMYKAGGNLIPDNVKYQAQFIDGADKNIKQHKDADGYLAMSSSSSTYTGENQQKVGKVIMSMEPYFDKEINIKAQTALTDDIQNCDVKNQAAMHKLVSSSSYTEIRKYAAENIHNLDESVQAEAVKITYDTKDASAIEACNSQLDLCKGDLSPVQNEINSQQQVIDYRYSENAANSVANSYVQIQKTYSGMSSTELNDYYKQKQQEFLNANSEERYNIISSLPEQMKKEAYFYLAKSRSNLLSLGMIKDIIQMGYASKLLSDPSVSSKVKFSLIHQMFESGASNKKMASKFVIENEAIFAQETVEIAENILNDNNIDIKEITLNGRKFA